MSASAALSSCSGLPGSSHIVIKGTDQGSDMERRWMLLIGITILSWRPGLGPGHRTTVEQLARLGLPAPLPRPSIRTI